MSEKAPVAIFGAAGLTGRELIRILSQHPAFEPALLTSDRHAGQKVAQVFPDLQGLSLLEFQKHSTQGLPRNCSVLLATPDTVALQTVPELLERGHRVIDLSGAFRLKAGIFEKTYGQPHPAPEILTEAIYGSPEINKEQIRQARLVANPGCFPTGCVFALYALKEALSGALAVAVDAKSGVSGAGGRTEDAGFLYHNVYENFRAYKVLKHQHNPEIQAHTQAPLDIQFVPHLLPLFRGILSTIYIHWKDHPPDSMALLKEAAGKTLFVRLLEEPESIELKNVQHTNYLDIAVRTAGRTTVVVTALDNLIKGAAGQAVQNLNICHGLSEDSGLYF